MVLERLAADDDLAAAAKVTRCPSLGERVLWKRNVEARELEFVISACAGELVKGSPTTRILRINTDSRQSQPGDLFVALSGERFDGHNFVGEVVQKGAVAVLVERGGKLDPLADCAVIRVENARRALGQIAARYRKDFSLPVVAVAGSNGKTSTKELIAAVLRQKLATLWSEASFNNDIGVPATLVAPGEIASGGRVGSRHESSRRTRAAARDDPAGTRRYHQHWPGASGVFRRPRRRGAEEGTLAEVLPPDGKLFLNGDNEWTDRLAKRTRAQVCRVGLGEGNDWRARNVRLEKRGMVFRVDAPQAEFSGEYRINLLGRHQVVNSLFALALGAELGLSRAEVGARAGRM